MFDKRVQEADEFYGKVIPANLSREEKNTARQAFAGLLWGKQFYHYIVKDWIDGDPGTRQTIINVMSDTNTVDRTTEAAREQKERS